MTRVLVVQTAWLGDVLLTTPLVDALAAADGPVDVLVTPDAAPLLAHRPSVRTVLTYDKRGRARGPVALWRMARALRARRYDRAVLPHGSLRSALLARLAGIPHRVGFAGAPGARWYTERRRRPEGHETERLMALAAASGSSALALPLTAGDCRAADAALEAAGVTRPFVALAPGSARPTKRWPHYGALAQALAPEMPVVVIGAAGDADAPGPQADLTGLPLRVAAAVLARAAVAVVNDSAPLHLAQAVGTPVVAIFGPTHPSLGFGPRGPWDVALGLALACRPCSTHGGRRCPLRHHRCLRELSADTVLEAVRRVLAAEEVLCVS